MGYVKVSVPKVGTAPGTPGAKNPNIIIVDIDDIQTMPVRSEGDVCSTGNLVLKTGAKAICVYATRSTIKRKDTQEGTADNKGFKSEFEFEHPGDSAAINSFAEGCVNRGFVIISRESNDETSVRLQGDVCNPMYFSLEEQDDSEAKKKIFKFAQEQRDKYKMTHYSGEIPTAEGDTTPLPPAQEGGL